MRNPFPFECRSFFACVTTPYRVGGKQKLLSSDSCNRTHLKAARETPGMSHRLNTPSLMQSQPHVASQINDWNRFFFLPLARM